MSMGSDELGYEDREGEDEFEDDEGAIFYPGASAEELDLVDAHLPNGLPKIWRSVLSISNGFETVYPVCAPPYGALSTHFLLYNVTKPQDWASTFQCELPNVLPIAIDADGGYWGLDLDTLTGDGDCNVVQIARLGWEQYRHPSINSFLKASMIESDFTKLVNRL